MAVGQSAHISDWVIFHPIQDDPNFAVTGLVQATESVDGIPPVFAGPRNVIETNGDQYASPQAYSYPAASTTELWHNPTTITSVVVDGLDTYTTTAEISDRMGTVYRWTTKLERSGSGTLFEKNWMSKGQFSGTGNSMNMTDRAYEWLGAPLGPGGLQIAAHHNPTMGGGRQEGNPALPTDESAVQAYTGIVHFYENQAAGTSVATATGTAPETPAHSWFCCTPIDFNGDPDNSDISDHGAGIHVVGQEPSRAEDWPVLWWRKRHATKRTFNWNQMARIHRMDNAWYDARRWQKEDYVASAYPLVVLRTADLACVGRYFDKAYWLNIATNTLTEITDWNPSSPSVDHYRRFDAMTHRMVDVGPPAVATTPSLVPEGYVAMVLRNTSNELCVGLACRIYDSDESTNVDSRLETDEWNIASAAHNVYANSPPGDPDVFAVGRMSFISKSQTLRAPGWYFSTSWIYAGHWDDVQADFQVLYTPDEFGVRPIDYRLQEGELPQALRDSLLPTVDGGGGGGGDPLDPFPGSGNQGGGGSQTPDIIPNDPLDPFNDPFDPLDPRTDPLDPSNSGTGGGVVDPYIPPTGGDPGGDPGNGGGTTGGGTQDDIIVEDGTGLSNANSYTSVLFADQYITVQGGDATWSASSVAEKEASLRFASQWIDMEFHRRLNGYPLKTTQALQIPRAFAYDSNGNLIDGVPIALQKATAEIAKRHRVDPTQFNPDVDPGGNVSSDTVSVGPVSTTTTYAGERSSDPEFTAVVKLLILSGLIQGGGNNQFVTI